MSVQALLELDKVLHMLEKNSTASVEISSDIHSSTEPPKTNICIAYERQNILDDSKQLESVTADYLVNENEMSLGSIVLCMREFVNERNWQKFHTPRNLLLALVGEIGELSEIFQWKGEKCAPNLPNFSEEERIHLGEEMADVLLYLVRMSDVCGINLSSAVKDKMQKNVRKYPSNLCKGSSKKYTEYI